MYLHIVPKLYHRMANKCSLESIFIPELGFKIEANELSIGRPFPNKNIYVGMRKGRKSTAGIILRTDSKLNWFTTEYVWNVEGMGNITHRVTTYIEDDNFDMVSQYVLLNGAFDRWKNRTHPAYEDKAPVYIQPMMEYFLASASFLASPSKRESCDMWKEYEWGDFLTAREESFLAQTIE